MKSTKKAFSLLLILAAIMLVLSACGAGSGTGSNSSSGAAGSAANVSSESSAPAASAEPSSSPSANLLDSDKHPVVTIQMSNDTVIKVELYPEIAPNTVDNFISLVQKGYYDGLIFHRVIQGFMIQGGDPDGTGAGGPGYSIPGEFTSNGFQNDLKHTRGVISMARTGEPNSAGSQFFIMVADAPTLDNEYASFGAVIEGMDAVDQIVNQPTNSQDRPNEPLLMTKVTVDLKGMTFEEPEKTK
ncbi:peptidylprolyl isomerase [Paenibacillus sp. BIHB 4019]|uniref:Peptidyl-prolyl cis-trans isomerase n=1 Tax=Paenibacillus sp. BIHB 4019 TaxID=1870819 RepID=A0A1B2DSF5_9BACL|nr:peptidylprolyl isomerase [Paenibacillus sp. BIHB 4019]ANY70635.1 peptidylprolyl isomerase [Paenibacillus sp. BIHB 4019]